LTESQQLPFWLSPGLLELLLCAVGYPPENRRMLKVFDKDTCLRTRFHLWEDWKKKLLHLTGFTQMEQAASAMAAHAAGEYRTARVVAEIQKDVAVPKMSQPIEPKEPTPSAAVIVSGEVSENACQEPPGQEEERTPPLSRVEQSTPIGPQVRLSVSETDSLEVQPPAEPGASPAGTPSSPPQVPKKGVRPKSIEDLGALPRKKQDLSEYIDAARLTELQLTCFSLRFERGLSIADIARLLGRDRKTIQEHIESAKKRIDVTRMKERFKKRSARSGME